MRFLKRLFRIFLLVLILGVVGIAILHYMSTRTPDGYAPLLLTEAQRDAASKRVEMQKLPRLLNLANESAAKASSAHRAQSSGAAAPAAATRPTESVTVSFTQDEINSSVWKLAQTDKYRAEYARYVTDPYVSLQDDGQIVIMGNVPEFGRVASAYFEPKLDESGMLRFDLASLKVGSLPLPQAVLSKKRAQVEASLRAMLPPWQQKAKIDESGVANQEATFASRAQFALHSLNNLPSPAVIFLPKSITDKKPTEQTVPLRLTKVTIEKGELTITVRPMEASERAELIEQIRKPVETATPGANATAVANPPPKG